MDNFEWFILGVLGLIALVGCHRRYIRYRIVKVLLDKGATDAQISKIMKAYKEE